MYQIENYDLTWDSLGKNAADSMPTGNGDMGANIWTEESGDLLLYLGKTDALDENGRLLKVGRLRVSLTPALLRTGTQFSQTLSLKDSVVYLKNEGFTLKIWVDANHPILRISGEGKAAFDVTAALELWRYPHPLRLEDKREGRTDGGSDGSHSESGLVAAGVAIPVTADVVVPGEELVWYHRNEESVWAGELEHQGLSGFTKQANDPLLHLTTGGQIGGEGFSRVDGSRLQKKACKSFDLEVVLLTEQTGESAEWVTHMKALFEKETARPVDQCFAAHKAHWNSFWERSHIHMEADGADKEEAETLTQTWHLHRYLVACAARGNLPLKFNGSIFNVDGQDGVETAYCHAGYDADFRAWGACYWFQNQRQIYWAMLGAGDFPEMLPFFEMYKKALPYARFATEKWFGHSGAFFPETMYFWGGYSRADYGLTPAADRTEPGIAENGYVKRYWQGGLELCYMMLCTYRYTGDKGFFSETLTPVVTAVLEFYAQHYPRDSKGKLHFYPAQALETIWDAVNPLPEIAGLQAICKGLLGECGELLSVAQKTQLQELLTALPPLTIREREGTRYLESCESADGVFHNEENIAMYAVFPYRIYGVGREDLALVRDTFGSRKFDRCYSCWHNNNVFAAYLGLTEQARTKLAERCRLHTGYRFPAFYTDGDWVPDHDNGGVIQQTLQAMLVQDLDDELLLFPAFPKHWDVDFKLAVPGGTVSCTRKNGVVTVLSATPEGRKLRVWENESSNSQDI